MVPRDTEGDRNLFQLGQPLGFNTLASFDGMQYRYFGNFTTLRVETILWRVRTLLQILAARFASLPERVKLGVASVGTHEAAAITAFLQQLKIMLLVTSDRDRDALRKMFAEVPPAFEVVVCAVSDVVEALHGVI